MTEQERLRRILQSQIPLAATDLYNVCLDALDHGLFEEITVRVERALATGAAADHRLWQILGLARRGMLDAQEAKAAFTRAAALAPQDALVAHSLARSAAEAGFPASVSYHRALALDPANGDILLGMMAARAMEGDRHGALAFLAETLDLHPGWHAGHGAYAGVATVSGVALTTTVERALARFPHDPELWHTLIRIELQDRAYAAAYRAAKRAKAVTGGSLEWDRIEAMCLSELGEAARAQALFDRMPPATRAKDSIHPIRNLIRLGRLPEAARCAEASFGEAQDRVLWPYRALLWRILGNPGWEWLEGDPRLVGVYDLADAAGDFDELAETLRSLHERSGTMLDQSVRGGTQTDGHLFARAEPALRRLRAVLQDTVASHIAQLPAPVAGHPTLIGPKPPYRFAGAWSVRLIDSGFHVDHVHPQGWLSSAFYVTLPSPVENARDGWLALGECRDLLPDIAGFRHIEPIVGRLILFPSTMWHGTLPFRSGERMTVAFDIVPS